MKVLIWGTGKTAKLAIENGICGQIVGFIDTVPAVKTFTEKPVYSPQSLDIEYDAIYVVSHNGEEVFRAIKKANIPIDKVCFKHPPHSSEIDIEVNLERGARFLAEGNLVRVYGYAQSRYSFVLRDIQQYNQMNIRDTFKYSEKDKMLCVTDKFSDAGTLGNYFFQDLWAAKLINRNKPKKHYDIGSRIDGFIAHLLSFRDDVTLIDIRPMKHKIPGVHFLQADATNLDTISDNSIESLSALCSLEHFGLGRYGDTIDPEACFKAFAAIQRKVAPGGMVYISVPIGKEHLEFNSDRIFYATTIVDSFSEMQLIEFNVTDGVKIEAGVKLNQYDEYKTRGAELFGLFCFMKPM